MKFSVFDELVDSYSEGRASATEVEQLNQLIRDDERSRDRFLELKYFDSGIRDLVGKISYEPLEDLTQKRDTAHRDDGRRRQPVALWSLACLILLLITCPWRLWLPDTNHFAVVESCVGDNSLQEGMQLDGRWHFLNSGTVSLITAKKARVVIEAPAQLRFESSDRLNLVRGRLAADVPPSAKRFTVLTPSGNAIDLGTRFGVDVSQRGDAEIHVFQGEVIAEVQAGGKNRNLFHGDAVHMHAGLEASRSLRSGAFIQPNEIASLHAAIQLGQQTKSESMLARLRRDPSLIMLQDFELGSTLDGRFQLVQGRWPGSCALEFVHVGDHLKLDVGGDQPHPQLTMAVWTRLDHLTEELHSILHTNRWFGPQDQGALHWMVTQSKSMRLAIRDNRRVLGSRAHSHEIESQASDLFDQGRWAHLAVVYDSEQKVARVYLNGRKDGEVKFDTAYPGLLGAAQIGNWDTYDRRLSGRIDEMVILGRALSDQEIQELYDAGNPYG
ncbi:LamG-like jellyroll fold domain-containing protein [Planctomicrobium sp. SH661]|uniref:LamG-like jellyroll fold domain-containing protein n=1 Tax=Planctomicrobium sp. SH661 TaxID=3448124 RepID=UPI003F5BB711